MTAQVALKAKTATFTNVSAAMKKSQLETQNAFFAALLIQGFVVEASGENEITIKNNQTGAEHTGIVVGSKVVILTGEAIKKAGLSLKLNHSIALDTFAKSENAYVLDMEANTVKGAKIAYGWIPAEGTENTITTAALMALANVTLVSTKPVDGAIEHFVIGQGKNVSTDSIKEVRATLTSIIEENGGFVTVEKEPTEPKARKPYTKRELSYNEQETARSTSRTANGLDAAQRQEHKKACKAVKEEALLNEKIRARRLKEQLKYAA